MRLTNIPFANGIPSGKRYENEISKNIRLRKLILGMTSNKQTQEQTTEQQKQQGHQIKLNDEQTLCQTLKWLVLSVVARVAAPVSRYRWLRR